MISWYLARGKGNVTKIAVVFEPLAQTLLVCWVSVVETTLSEHVTLDSLECPSAVN